MTVAVIATVVVADFPVHPSRQPIVIVLAVVAARNFIFGHDFTLYFLRGRQVGRRDDTSDRTGPTRMAGGQCETAN